MNTCSTSTEPIDILTIKLPITTPSVIIGNGPLGNGSSEIIPDDIYTIGINGAIKQLVNYDLWMCTSPDAPPMQLDWWDAGINSNIPSLMDYRMRAHNPTYVCRQYGYKKAPARYGDNYLVAGGTTAGVAIDLLAKNGCKHIVLCGIDMTGHQHADGSSCRWAINGKMNEGDIWHTKRGHLQDIIYRTTDSGVRIESLSPTLLDVPIARKIIEEWKHGDR